MFHTNPPEPVREISSVRTNSWKWSHFSGGTAAILYGVYSAGYLRPRRLFGSIVSESAKIVNVIIIAFYVPRKVASCAHLLIDFHGYELLPLPIVQVGLNLLFDPRPDLISQSRMGLIIIRRVVLQPRELANPFQFEISGKRH